MSTSGWHNREKLEWLQSVGFFFWGPWLSSRCYCNPPKNCWNSSSYYNAMFRETLHLGIHVDFILTRPTHLNIFTDQIHPLNTSRKRAQCSKLPRHQSNWAFMGDAMEACVFAHALLTFLRQMAWSKKKKKSINSSSFDFKANRLASYVLFWFCRL